MTIRQTILHRRWTGWVGVVPLLGGLAALKTSVFDVWAAGKRQEAVDVSWNVYAIMALPWIFIGVLSLATKLAPERMDRGVGRFVFDSATRRLSKPGAILVFALLAVLGMAPQMWLRWELRRMGYEL